MRTEKTHETMEQRKKSEKKNYEERTGKVEESGGYSDDGGGNANVDHDEPRDRTMILKWANEGARECAYSLAPLITIFIHDQQTKNAAEEEAANERMALSNPIYIWIYFSCIFNLTSFCRWRKKKKTTTTRPFRIVLSSSFRFYFALALARSSLHLRRCWIFQQKYYINKNKCNNFWYSTLASWSLGCHILCICRLRRPTHMHTHVHRKCCSRWRQPNYMTHQPKITIDQPNERAAFQCREKKAVDENAFLVRFLSCDITNFDTPITIFNRRLPFNMTKWNIPQIKKLSYNRSFSPFFFFFHFEPGN